MNIVDVKKQEIHKTELLVRALNRRLESYGKVMYTPEYSTDITHLEQYNVLEKKIYAMLATNGFITTSYANGNVNTNIRDNIVGAKGTYIQISRSKDNLESLISLQSEMQTIINATPTWQELQQIAELETGKKLKRKEKLEMIKRMSTIMKIESMVEFLGESENVDVNDSKLFELLKPFRNYKKGGTRQKRQRVSQADWDMLVEYLKQKYAYGVNNTYDLQTSTQTEFDDKFTNARGLLDFSNSNKSI